MTVSPLLLLLLVLLVCPGILGFYSIVRCVGRRHYHVELGLYGGNCFQRAVFSGTSWKKSGAFAESSSAATTSSMANEDLHEIRGTNNENNIDPSASIIETSLPAASPGYVVVQEYTMPPEGFAILQQPPTDTAKTKYSWLNQDLVERLGLSPENVTLPVALLLLDPSEYSSLSRARKECRQGNIVVVNHSYDNDYGTSTASFITTRGRVQDRIYPGNRIGKQVRTSHGSYSAFVSPKHDKNNKGNAPFPFDLPVIYEDDHCAIVNKPAGVLVYAEGAGGRNTVRYALPYVLTPPPQSTMQGEHNDALSRPVACHRLDKPTSGLLVVSKTKSASVHLTQQFEDRLVQKTYVAIVQGIPKEDPDKTITSQQARAMGVGVDINSPSSNASSWQLADTVLEGKRAITVWKSLGRFPSLTAPHQTLTMVELKPKTGRYHQLRRTMAWLYKCPIVGDTTYEIRNEDESGDGLDSSVVDTSKGNNADAIIKAKKRWRRGLMLSSNKVRFQHPFYNTEEGRSIWQASQQRSSSEAIDDDRLGGATSITARSNVVETFSTDKGENRSTIMVTASVDVPPKFGKFLEQERLRYSYQGEKIE